MNKFTQLTAALSICATMFGCSSALDPEVRGAKTLQVDDVVDTTQVPDTDTPPPAETPVECVPETGDCEFTTYNLDVRVGDQFILAHFVECEGPAGAFVFAYEDGEDWNLDAFNADELVTIVEADLLGGNKSEGRYRLSMLDAMGDEVDHMTIRIDHADQSDVGATHAAPLVRPPALDPALCYSDDPGPGDDDDRIPL